MCVGKGAPLHRQDVLSLPVELVFDQEIPLILEIAFHVLSFEGQQLYSNSGDPVSGGERGSDAAENQGNDQQGQDNQDDL